MQNFPKSNPTISSNPCDKYLLLSTSWGKRGKQPRSENIPIHPSILPVTTLTDPVKQIACLTARQAFIILRHSGCWWINGTRVLVQPNPLRFPLISPTSTSLTRSSDSPLSVHPRVNQSTFVSCRCYSLSFAWFTLYVTSRRKRSFHYRTNGHGTRIRDPTELFWRQVRCQVIMGRAAKEFG